MTKVYQAISGYTSCSISGIAERKSLLVKADSDPGESSIELLSQSMFDLLFLLVDRLSAQIHSL